jgi:hypothetical protein
MSLRLFRVIVVGIAASYLMGCAAAMTTVVSGRYDEVIVSTNPSNVSIYDEDGTRLALSPAKLTIARKDQPTLYLRKNGFQDTAIVIKRHINRLIPISLANALVVGGLSFQGSPDGKNFLPWFLVASSINLIWAHLPDYFLGGAWDHQKEIEILMKKKYDD